MKRSECTKEQIAYALRQADGGTEAADVCRQTGISEATFFNWRRRSAGAMAWRRSGTSFALICFPCGTPVPEIATASPTVVPPSANRLDSVLIAAKSIPSGGGHRAKRTRR